MPSPVATAQHHNQPNHSERDTQAHRKLKCVKQRERAHLQTGEREEAGKEGMSSAKSFIKTLSPAKSPCRALIRPACLSTTVDTTLLVTRVDN